LRYGMSGGLKLALVHRRMRHRTADNLAALLRYTRLLPVDGSAAGTSTTWIYPFKWVSVASSTGTGAQFATTTDYVFNGDTLVATIDQETASGNATGTAKTRYVHPDHLGSTNVVTQRRKKTFLGM